MNLINKMIEKFKVAGHKLSDSVKNLFTSGDHKIAKRIASLALCTTMLVGLGSLSSCKKNDNPTVDPGSQTEQPGTDPTKPDTALSKYSKVLQTVLTSKYYTGLSDEMREDRMSNKYCPLPFNFLKKQGHDVENIKNDNLSCASLIYIKGDDTSNLYCNVTVDNVASPENYSTQYIIKYSLTEQEYKDLKMLYSGNYLQSYLFVQELDNVKSAQIINSANITTSSRKNLLDYLCRNYVITDNFKSKSLNSAILLDYSVGSGDTNTMTLLLGSFPSPSSVSSGQIGTINFTLRWNSGASVTNNIFDLPSPSRMEILNKQEFINSLEDTTTFYLPLSANKVLTV